jgi:hypothetical protein
MEQRKAEQRWPRHAVGTDFSFELPPGYAYVRNFAPDYTHLTISGPDVEIIVAYGIGLSPPDSPGLRPAGFDVDGMPAMIRDTAQSTVPGSRELALFVKDVGDGRHTLVCEARYRSAEAKDLTLRIFPTFRFTKPPRAWPPPPPSPPS